LSVATPEARKDSKAYWEAMAEAWEQKAY
jgi:hypothetical protein